MTRREHPAIAEPGEPDGDFRLRAFFPYRINILANTVSEALAQLYAKRFDLTRPEWRVLATLGDKAGMTARDVGADTTLEKMQVSRAVARLERDGLVTRLPDKGDRRNKILRLTPRGRALFRKIVPLVRAREDYILSALTPGEQATLRVLMEKVETRARDLAKRG